MFAKTLLTACVVLMSAPLSAHEFWLDQEEFHVDVGGDIAADFRVGSEFKGPRFAFLDNRSIRTDYQIGGVIRPLPTRTGDRPALQMSDVAEGLTVLIHETTDSDLVYRDWEKFQNFVAHKDFKTALADHAARGLPQTGFRESYRRYAKALIDVGHGAGADMRAGLPLEFVALTNPYTDDLSDGFTAQLWMGDTPRADAQVEVFERAPSGEILITLYRTNAEGIVTVPVKAGHVYMIDNVALLPRDPAREGDAVWHSDWANLIFKAPAR